MNQHERKHASITLMGIQIKTAEIKMDENGNFISKIEMFVNTISRTKNYIYKIIAFGDDALKIRKYGFPGLRLKVEGMPHPKNIKKIIANKIFFIDTPESNGSTKNVDNYCYYKNKNKLIKSNIAEALK